MERLKKILARQEELRSLVKKENRDYTAEEATEIRKLLDEATEIRKNIELQKDMDELRGWAGESEDKNIPKENPGQGENRSAEILIRKTFKNPGEQFRAIAMASSPGGYYDERLNAYKPESRAAGSGNDESTGSNGEFLVQTDFAEEFLKNTWDNSQILSRCSKRTISTGSNSIEFNGIDETSRADGSRFGGVRAYWVAELATTTASAPKFKKIKLDLKKLMGLYYASDEILEDAAFLGAEVQSAFTGEFGFKLQDAIIEGDGSGKPLGILKASCLVSVAKETNQAATTLVAENIIKMWSRCPATLRGNSVWVINQDIEPQLYTMSIAVGGSGGTVFMPPGGISGNQYATLFGRPIIPIEQASSLGTVGDIMLCDFSQYVVATKGGIQGASSIHLKFDYNQTTYRWVMRVDGQPKWSSALTPFKGTGNTLSPFVAVATR
jgi:HK97 family phage major capsid protein